MTKIRRGGYIFNTWVGDHSPKHVHVMIKGRIVFRWDLENNRIITGLATRKMVKLILELQEEGKL
jgi:hypothetical protein